MLIRVLGVVGALLVFVVFASEAKAAQVTILRRNPTVDNGGGSGLSASARDEFGTTWGDGTVGTIVGLSVAGSLYVHRSTVTTSVRYDYSQSAFEFHFGLELRHVAAFSYFQGGAYFTVDEDIDFTLSGLIAADAPAATRIAQRAVLRDWTTGINLFQSYQESRTSPDEVLTLGENGGDFLEHNPYIATGNPAVWGSLTGTLVAGHVYQLNIGKEITDAVAPSFATAEGYIKLTFDPEYWVSLHSPPSAILVEEGVAWEFRAHLDFPGITDLSSGIDDDSDLAVFLRIGEYDEFMERWGVYSDFEMAPNPSWEDSSAPGLDEYVYSTSAVPPVGTYQASVYVLNEAEERSVWAGPRPGIDFVDLTSTGGTLVIPEPSGRPSEWAAITSLALLCLLFRRRGEARA